jgi:hypothetical protein
MTIQYIWGITKIKAYPTVEDKTNVICTVEWKLTVTNGERNKQIFGTISIPIVHLEPFTPYDQLTEEQVLGWVHNEMGPVQIAQLEAGVLSQLEQMINPPVLVVPLPWVRQPGPIDQEVPADEGEVTSDPQPPDASQEEIDARLESQWSNIREERNQLLAECDWTQLPDAPVETAVWSTYRQALRDITLQEDPFNIVWPEKP